MARAPSLARRAHGRGAPAHRRPSERDSRDRAGLELSAGYFFGAAPLPPPACSALRAFARLAKIAEPREVGLEMQVEVAGRSVAMFRELQTDDTFFAVFAVLLPQEEHEIGV